MTSSSIRPKYAAMLDELTAYAALDVRDIGRIHADLWKTHTDHNKQLVLAAAHLTPNKQRCVVIGAGPCYDIPLLELAQLFEQIELLDLNPASLTLALHRIPPDLIPKIECRAVEITHALPKALHGIKQEFLKAGTRNQRAINKAVSILNNQIVGLGELAHVKGNLVVSDMILSQLPTSLWIVDDWYSKSFRKSIMDDAGWVQAMTTFKEKIQNAHISGLLSMKDAVVVLTTDFGVAASAEEATLESIAHYHRITLTNSTMQTIETIRTTALVEKTWLWHRDDSPPKWSPVWGLVFRPESVSP